MPNYNIKIDVTKILKEHLFQGKNGAKYLDITLWENRDGPDQYGNTHRADQSISKEAREAGEKGPILGNAREFAVRGGSQSRQSPPSNQQRQQGGNQARRPDAFPAGEDEIPF